MKRAFLCALVAAATLTVFTNLQNPLAPTPPNVVLIFMDDLGYGDLGCYRALNYQTPHIDQLAKEGIRFTNFLTAQAVCTASRAALLTGCYPNRLGLSGALFPNAKVGLNPTETTMAELLGAKGYATAVFGKWHLGDHATFMPLQQGFDEYVGLPYSNDMWPVNYNGKPFVPSDKSTRFNFPKLPLMNGRDTLRTINTLDDQAELTGIYTRKATEFIEKNRKKPFFLYLPHSMPHVPIAASAAFRGKSKAGLYGDMMMEVDWSVGEIAKTLKERLRQNTLVIFTSDNGPWLNLATTPGSAAGLREGKGTTYEGGNRVPCLVRWTGTIPAGIVCNQLASTLDLLPTIARLCKTDLPKQKIDGVDLAPLLAGQTDASLVENFTTTTEKNSLEAVRRDHWKLVFAARGSHVPREAPGVDGFPGKVPEDFQHPLALYDLRRDPGERYDVKEWNPEIVAELQKLAETARQDLGDDITKRVGANVRPVGSL